MREVHAGAWVLASAFNEQVIPLAPPIIIYGNGSSSLDVAVARAGDSVGARDPDAARAAKERAMQPSVLRAPAAPGVNSTQAYYEWVGGGGDGGPPGGYTRQERF